MERIEPLISVVIPTRNRPNLVIRAIRSVLTQTCKAIEVIVVIDGPNEETWQVLRKIDDSRVRVLTLPENLGIGGARNAGAKEARSHWVAYLDDDDEWFPQKLEIQLQTAQQSHHPYPIISCRLITRSESGDLIWPRRYPRPNEPLSEYLFCQSNIFGGEGIIIPSTILTMKGLLQKVPFKRGLKTHDDWDWLLRASTTEGVSVEFVSCPEPLVIWNMEKNRPRISNTKDWRYSLSWVRANRHLFTRRAYVSFIMTQVSLIAAPLRDWKAFWLLIREAYRNGKPSMIDLLAHLIIWIVPLKVRRQMTGFIDRRRNLPL